MGVAQRVAAAPWVAGLAARSGAMSDAFNIAEWLGGEIEDPRTRAPHVLPEKLKVMCSAWPSGRPSRQAVVPAEGNDFPP